MHSCTLTPIDHLRIKAHCIDIHDYDRTNITEPWKEYPASRGCLASSFLLSDLFLPLEAEVGRIIPQDSIAGFNLLLFGPALRPDGSLHFDSLLVTNHGGGGTVSSRPLSSAEQSCGCISNAVDGTIPAWPKVDHAAQEFGRLLYKLSPSMSEAELTDGLFEMLRRVSCHSISVILLTYVEISPKSWRSPQHITSRIELRNTVHVAPFPTPGANLYYGTRLSSVLLVKKSGEALFIERDIWRLVDEKPVKADPRTQREFRFRVFPHGPEI